MPPVFDRDKCNGCGVCDVNCPVDVIAMDEENKATSPYPRGVLALRRVPHGLP